MAYTTISIDETTKNKFDKQRQTPKGEVSADDYLKYLLEKEEKR